MADQLVQALDALLADKDPRSAGKLVALVDAVANGTKTLDDLKETEAAVRSLVAKRLPAGVPDVPGLRDALRSLGDADLTAAGVTRTVSLGPGLIAVAVPAAVVKVPSPPAVHVIALVPSPTGSLGLGAPGLSGGGALAVSAERLAGALGVGVGPLEVLGAAILRAPQGQAASLLVLLSARFSPAVQLGFGFGLNAVGGIVGANRRVDTDRLRRRLADGGAAAALFPQDPVRDAGTLWDALEDFFPVSPGTQVLGPTFALTWLDLPGIGPLVRADLALLLQLPDVK
ncbi:DUF6603 domain-containing protein, partial [Kitasatospora sp. NPDC093558]|uniref:DUF6603 domain-containing protein n=1 Tax=Kitasatospora sp. NPDC093558 TaxID=3155201 RepID=UPI00343CDDD4